MRGEEITSSIHSLQYNLYPFCIIVSVSLPPQEVFMKYQLLTDSEMENQVSGEALTLTAVMAVLATAIIAVIVYKLFLSDKGNATVPGGWKFSWN